MNTDKSKIVYDKLDEVQNKKVKLHLVNHKIKTGFLIGFFHGDKEFIERWLFQEVEELIFNPEEGEIIQNKDILEVFFFDDNSQIIF